MFSSKHIFIIPPPTDGDAIISFLYYLYYYA